MTLSNLIYDIEDQLGYIEFNHANDQRLCNFYDSILPSYGPFDVICNRQNNKNDIMVSNNRIDMRNDFIMSQFSFIAYDYNIKKRYNSFYDWFNYFNIKKLNLGKLIYELL